MFFQIFIGIMLPLLGTVLGAGCVYFFNRNINATTNKIFMGFAGGVMVAASVWSLIIPSINYSANLGKFAFFPAVAGLWAGVFFLVFLDKFFPCKEKNDKQQDMFFWAVLIHNIPEGMAVGVIYSGILSGNTEISLISALVLSIGIAVQNFPEGAIISLPMMANGKSKHKSFFYGAISGIVEPIGAISALLAVTFISPVLPYVLGFAAGAMIYVVLTELVPEFETHGMFSIGNISFMLGFTVMMILDVIVS